MAKKPGRPMTRLFDPIQATPEDVAAAICRAADGKIRQSLGPVQRPAVRLSVASRASASRRGRGQGPPSA